MSVTDEHQIPRQRAWTRPRLYCCAAPLKFPAQVSHANQNRFEWATRLPRLHQLKPLLIWPDLRGAKAPLYHSAAGFREFFRRLRRHARTRIRFAVSNPRVLFVLRRISCGSVLLSFFAPRESLFYSRFKMQDHTETLSVGSRAPEFSLPAANREGELSLSGLLARGPLIIEFARGNW
jgi:hypothetical protein